MSPSPKLFITGATGKLGGHTIDSLLRRAPNATIIAGVRDSETDAAAAIRAKGVEIRTADYSRPETLVSALEGVNRLLLISGNAMGTRREQHRAVISAAREAGIGLIAYTSILHADTSPLLLANDHRDTEEALSTCGVPFVVLRNGWYTENYGLGLPNALERGTYAGAAGDGRISTAARADYAEANAAVLTEDGHAGHTYELAGDTSFTLAELVSAVSDMAGKQITYENMTPEAFRAAAIAAGTPEAFASLLANIDAGVAKGALFDDSGALSQLIGRPTTPFRTTLGPVVDKLVSKHL